MKMQMGSDSRGKAGKLFDSQTALNLFRWPTSDCLVWYGVVALSPSPVPSSVGQRTIHGPHLI